MTEKGQNKRIYVFPPSNPQRNGKNPYVLNFEQSLRKYFILPEREKVFDGVVDLLVNFRADIWILNWPENLISRRFGFFQVVVYTLLLFAGRIFGKKIIWILHNKKSHDSSGRLSDFAVNITAKLNSMVITHSTEGIEYYRKRFKRDNIEYYPHPAYPDLHFDHQCKPEYDLIIWGSVMPYKKITDFLKYAKLDEALKLKKLIICGHCKNLKYSEEIENLIKFTPNFTFQNKFFENSILIEMISRSKAILFTYGEESTLSSGALVFSLNARKLIIGPGIGSFRDLGNDKMIANYNSFEDIAKISENFHFDVSRIDDYLLKYTWQNFAAYLKEKI